MKVTDGRTSTETGMHAKNRSLAKRGSDRDTERRANVEAAIERERERQREQEIKIVTERERVREKDKERERRGSVGKKPLIAHAYCDDIGL